MTKNLEILKSLQGILWQS